jgi:predicted Rossmann fold flavoprotein
MKSELLCYDVIVIGGGPAGMMAAATAAARGRSVLLLEKNASLGKKLLITGGGRCNVTNNKPVVREMLSQYKGSGKFFFSTFMQHGVKETVEWFHEHGVDFIEENEGRLFPKTEQARTIHETLVHELAAHQVTIKTKQTVQSVKKDRKNGTFTVTTTSHTYICTTCVLATGGTSRPETGSTGDGYTFAKSFGHTVVENNFALVPLTLATTWTKNLSGITLPKVKLAVYAGNKKELAVSGKLLFTHVGITGPTILNMSKQVGEWLQYAPVTIMVDLFPNDDAGALKTMLQSLFLTHSNKTVRNTLATILPTALVTGILGELGITVDTPCHSVSSEDRKRLFTYLKAMPLRVKGLLGADKAVISGGGIDLREVNFKTMESTIAPGLYLIGDVLNVDRPSGGYSLQLCWSTGYVAGVHV